MRLAAFAIALLGAVWSVLVPAASADTLRVTGDGVNVRAGPELGAAVMLQVHSDQEAVELDRDDPWVRVRLRDRAVEGWIHGSLLAPATEAEEGQGGPVVAAPPPEASEPEPATDPAVESSRPVIEAALAPVDQAALESFKGSVDYINRRATRMAGTGLFSDVEATAPGEVRVVATDVWGTIPPGGQKSYLNTLYLRWGAASATGGPLRVEVVDESGAVLMEKSGP